MSEPVVFLSHLGIKEGAPRRRPHPATRSTAWVEVGLRVHNAMSSLAANFTNPLLAVPVTRKWPRRAQRPHPAPEALDRDFPGVTALRMGEFQSAVCAARMTHNPSCLELPPRHTVHVSACHTTSISSRSARLAGSPQDLREDGTEGSCHVHRTKSMGTACRTRVRKISQPTLLSPSWKRKPFEVETISRARTRLIEPYHAADRGT